MVVIWLIIHLTTTKLIVPFHKIIEWSVHHRFKIQWMHYNLPIKKLYMYREKRKARCRKAKRTHFHISSQGKSLSTPCIWSSYGILAFHVRYQTQWTHSYFYKHKHKIREKKVHNSKKISDKKPTISKLFEQITWNRSSLPISPS